jgi:hypothetical protein
LIVRAYDQDPKAPENAVTDAEGRYESSFTENDFKVGGVESGGPDVFIRVYDGDELPGESTVKRDVEKRISIDLRVDYAEADPNKPLGGCTAWSVMPKGLGRLLGGSPQLSDGCAEYDDPHSKRRIAINVHRCTRRGKE